MSFSQGSQNEAILELRNEITFQRILLESLAEENGNIENREEAIQQVQEEIRTLKGQLKALLPKPYKARSASKPRGGPLSSGEQAPSAFEERNKDKRTMSAADTEPNSETDRPSHSRSATVKKMAYNHNQYAVINQVIKDMGMLPALYQSDSGNASGISSYVSTPNTAPSPSDIISPSKMTLPTRKRSHSQHHEGLMIPQVHNKSHRTSPSPFASRAVTPMSSSGDEAFINFDENFFIIAAREAEQRAKQEKDDAELARLLQNEESSAGWSPSFASQSSTSAFAQSMSGPSSSNYTAPPARKSLPWKQEIKREPKFSQMAMGAMDSAFNQQRSFGGPFFQREVKQEPGNFATTTSASYFNSAPTHSVGSPSTIKNESSSSIQMPGAFGGSSGDDDSDIEIISSSEFHSNGRHQMGKFQTLQAGLFSRIDDPSPVPANSESTNSSTHALYGKKGPRDWITASNGTFQQPGSGINTYFPASGSVYSPGPSSIPAIPGAYPSGTMFGSGLGFGYQRNNIANYLGNEVDLTGDSDQESYLGEFGIDMSEPNTFEDETDAFGLQMQPNNPYLTGIRRSTEEDIKSLLANIRPDEDLPEEDREGTPDGLKYPLYEHQKLALTWLKSMEEGTSRGGILADDMGLGKTISALALILARPSPDPARKTTLIVGPVALVRQWEREIQSKINFQHRLSTFMMHGRAKGKGKSISWQEIRVFDVVLTTYGTIAAEWGRMEKWVAERNIRPELLDQVAMSKLFPLLSPKSLFHRVILDEAQCIKNKNTVSAKSCYSIRATYRLCLTGTPMMNNIGELYSLVLFLRIKPYNEWSRFRADFGSLFNQKGRRGQDTKQGMKRLQILLKAILLRRVKSSLIDGKPIITLPPKTEETQHVVFDEEEQAFYQALESKTQLQFNKYLKKGTVGKNYSNILVLLLRLRQACCHPHLIQDFEQAPSELTAGDMIALAKTLDKDVVARILAADDSFECPICYDGVPNPAILIPCGHDCCAECLAKLSDQAVRDNLAQGNDVRNVSKCPACRSSIDMAKFIDYSTFKKAFVETPEEEIETASEHSESASDSESESESNSDSDTDDVDSDGDLRNFIVRDDIEEPDDEQSIQDDDELREKKATKIKKIKKGKKPAKKTVGKGAKKVEHVSIAMLKTEANKSAKGRRRYMKYLRKNWEPSAKVAKCVELLEKFQNEGEKTIIFSQFVSLLDLIQIPVENKGWNFERYDGSMNAEDRNDAIIRFTESLSCKIMFISLKAGNAGLNLVAASRVIILDPFWNPYIEMQAVDRAYRIGQQKAVQVHRILVEGTVEDRIIALQEQKRKMVDAALDEEGGKSISRLGIEQLRFLFFGGGTGGA